MRHGFPQKFHRKTFGWIWPAQSLRVELLLQFCLYMQKVRSMPPPCYGSRYLWLFLGSLALARSASTFKAFTTASAAINLLNIWSVRNCLILCRNKTKTSMIYPIVSTFWSGPKYLERLFCSWFTVASERERTIAERVLFFPSILPKLQISVTLIEVWVDVCWSVHTKAQFMAHISSDDHF